DVRIWLPMILPVGLALTTGVGTAFSTCRAAVLQWLLNELAAVPPSVLFSTSNVIVLEPAVATRTPPPAVVASLSLNVFPVTVALKVPDPLVTMLSRFKCPEVKVLLDTVMLSVAVLPAGPKRSNVLPPPVSVWENVQLFTVRPLRVPEVETIWTVSYLPPLIVLLVKAQVPSKL